MNKILTILVLLLVLGCTNQLTADYIIECQDLCTQAKAAGTDLSNGPCLSNDYYPDYVCDVAHNPRTSVDNQAENQCPAYGVTASHFVEVDEDCNYIKSV
jgi:hypothetical protein